MHELSVAIELHRSLRAEVEARGGGRLLSARIAVGELAAIEPRLLAYAWEAVVAGSPDHGATLELEHVPATKTCPECGVVDAPRGDGWLLTCPTCAAPLTLEGGQELDITSLTFDDAPAPRPIPQPQEVRS